MRIQIHSRKFPLTEGIREHIERRVHFTLSWANQTLSTVTLRLDDVNGPRGGEDKSCRVQIPLPGGKSVVVDELQADLYVAIDRAIERAGRAVSRQIERNREHAHVRYQVAEETSDTRALIYP